MFPANVENASLKAKNNKKNICGQKIIYRGIAINCNEESSRHVRTNWLVSLKIKRLARGIRIREKPRNCVRALLTRWFSQSIRRYFGIIGITASTIILLREKDGGQGGGGGKAVFFDVAHGNELHKRVRLKYMRARAYTCVRVYTCARPLKCSGECVTPPIIRRVNWRRRCWYRLSEFVITPQNARRERARAHIASNHFVVKESIGFKNTGRTRIIVALSALRSFK